MSLAKTTQVNCPFCQTPQTIQYYTSVNVTVDPQLKEKVLSQKLNISDCSECHKEIDVVSGFLYHDMTKRLMINFKVTNEQSDFEDSDITKQLAQNGYIFRIVYSIYDLIEKIKIFDNSLNDKVVASSKSVLKDSFREVIGDEKLYVYFTELKKSLFSKALGFTMFTHPSQLLRANIKIKNLTSDEKANIFNLDLLRNESWLAIDSEPDFD